MVWGNKECLCLGELEKYLEGGLDPCSLYVPSKQGDNPQPLYSPANIALAYVLLPPLILKQREDSGASLLP